MKYVNTGDRMMDNSLNTVLGIFVAYIFTTITTIEFYNKFMYYVVDRPKTPRDFRMNYYKYDTYEAVIKFKKKLLATANPKETYMLTRPEHNIIFSNMDIKAQVYEVFNGYPVYIIFDSSNTRLYIYSSNEAALADATSFINSKYRTEICNDPTKNSRNRCSLHIPKYDKDGSISYPIKSYISEKKTFDRIFYDKKQEIVNLLTNFKSGNLYPDSISMDNKLGILLYGPPGTGKTGTISAIANYLKRNIIVVNFSDTMTPAQLDAILDPARYKEYIYVFDEFDCLLDVLVGKKQEEKPEEKIDYAALLTATTDKDERATIIEMMKSKKPERITLGYLLQKLDGIEDATDRLIIATTNHPENINPALLRPGRFDLKLCLGNCSAQMYEDILTSFFKEVEKDIDEVKLRKQIAQAALPPGRWSPLQVMNVALVVRNLETTLAKLA